MPHIRMKRPGAATRHELERVVDNIQTILWPGGSEDAEWGADELGIIANILRQYGFAPEPRSSNRRSQR